jgi:5'-deoxynucleotidase YfbR-like HD superfamily hydrolase
MFSLIQKILSRVRSFDALFDRVEKIEAQTARFEKLADENESLWQMLDEQREADKVFVGSAAEFEEEFTEIMLRNLKPRGDA